MEPDLEATLKTVFVRDDSVLESDVGAEKVMMSIQNGNYYGLNEVAKEIYDRVDGVASVGQICDALFDIFDVEPEEGRQQVVTFVQALVDHGLVQAKPPT